MDNKKTLLEVFPFLNNDKVSKQIAYNLLDLLNAMEITLFQFHYESFKNEHLFINNGEMNYFIFATYYKNDDVIMVHNINNFDNFELYLLVLLHELGHATGHESRLNRDLSGAFGSESYAKEELRANLFVLDFAKKNNIKVNQKIFSEIEYWSSKVSEPDLFYLKSDAKNIYKYVTNLV